MRGKYLYKEVSLRLSLLLCRYDTAHENITLVLCSFSIFCVLIRVGCFTCAYSLWLTCPHIFSISWSENKSFKKDHSSLVATFLACIKYYGIYPNFDQPFPVISSCKITFKITLDYIFVFSCRFFHLFLSDSLLHWSLSVNLKLEQPTFTGSCRVPHICNQGNICWSWH